MTYKEKIIQVRKQIFDIIKSIAEKAQEAETGEKTEPSDELTDSDETPAENNMTLKCKNCPCWREYPFCAACLVDIGGDND